MNQRKACVMTLTTELGLDAHDPLTIIDQCWAGWADREPALRRVPDPKDLLGWLAAERVRPNPEHHRVANRALLALARLAAPDGGADTDAALVLAWLMLPTAATLARYFQGHDPDNVDAIVAGQLFIQVRTYPWRTRRGSVAAGIARDLRRHVSAEFGILRSVQRIVPINPLVFDQTIDDVEAHPATTVEYLLAEATEAGVITDLQRDLLRDVMDEAEIVGRKAIRRTQRQGGLTASAILTPVAGRRAMTERTVRRLVSRATGAIGEMASSWEVA